MDYDYYMRPVLELTPSVHSNLVKFAKQTPLDISQSYFNNRHPGFNSKTWKFTGNQSEFLASVDESVQAVVDTLDVIYPKKDFHAFEINSLEVGGEILLHTDQTPTTTSKIWRVPVYHSVHIPLTGTGLYESKRGYGEEFVQMRMKLGTVYSYNNYVLHQVKNIGDSKRFNIVLHYFDPEWKTKMRLYKHLGINERARF